MKNLIFFALISLMVYSCGRTSNSKTKQEQAILDSIQQAEIESNAKIKAHQDSIVQIEKFENERAAYHKTLNLRRKYIGKKYEYPISTDYIAEFGSPETLEGTDNNTWIVYFPKGDLTVVINKRDNEFVNICTGKYPELKNDVTADLSRLIDVKMSFNDYTNIVNSSKYGSSEKLGIANCINNDCVEFYPKGNFTTVAFREFNDNGDFVTLKKIAIGKLPSLSKF